MGCEWGGWGVRGYDYLSALTTTYDSKGDWFRERLNVAGLSLEHWRGRMLGLDGLAPELISQEGSHS